MDTCGRSAVVRINVGGNDLGEVEETQSVYMKRCNVSRILDSRVADLSIRHEQRRCELKAGCHCNIDLF